MPCINEDFPGSDHSSPSPSLPPSMQSIWQPASFPPSLLTAISPDGRSFRVGRRAKFILHPLTRSAEMERYNIADIREAQEGGEAGAGRDAGGSDTAVTSPIGGEGDAAKCPCSRT